MTSALWYALLLVVGVLAIWFIWIWYNNRRWR